MKVGVIVGRFQCDYLHDGHIQLIDKAIDENNLIIVFIGISPILGTKKHPLDYFTRHLMLENHFKEMEFENYIIQGIKDIPSDEEWDYNLDTRILSCIKFNDTVHLYGGQDSFLKIYNGKFKENQTLIDDYNVHATEIRDQITSGAPRSSEEFRAGVIYGLGNTFSVVSSTVDIACTWNSHVLVGRKEGETLWRLPGGFVDATDKNLEDAVRREFLEETGLSIEGGLRYVGSTHVNDWRFQEPDKAIMTTLFTCPYSFGIAKASDDLVEVDWLCLDEDLVNKMNPGHKVLIQMLLDWRYKNA
jgi:bifunctional NMN adenylyltransferase/nudix hydrolase